MPLSPANKEVVIFNYYTLIILYESTRTKLEPEKERAV